MFKKIAVSTIAAAVTMVLAGGQAANASTNKSTNVVDSAAIESFVTGKPEALKPFYRALFTDGSRNATLNNVRLGLAAIQTADYARAEQAFDTALEQIETIYANNDRAKQARSKFSKEAVKDFKGEPYERAMTYYYRGLLYMRAGDYENARASFLQGEWQTTVSETEEYTSSFPMLDYLAGWSSQCAGDQARAQELFELAHKSNPALHAPSPSDNVLVVAELGSAPVKVAAGKSRELLQFEKSKSDLVSSASYQLVTAGASTPIVGFEAGSVSHEALNRGGRAVQAILDGKAQFKSVTGAIGGVGNALGLGVTQAGYLQNNTDLAGAGLALGLAGALFSAMSEAAKPDADTRAWDNLPDAVQIATTARPSGEWHVRATFNGQPEQVVAPMSGAGQCSIVWTRSKSALAVGETAPGTQLSAREQKKLLKKFGAGDVQFRSNLLARE
jgi:tetratricopeptide (TPR) repeat protein